ncbi:MAG: HAD family hydrolase [Bryobacteraceae bacterium]|nr:HAD family hydrolase [Bryobacteraceae bacterium]
MPVLQASAILFDLDGTLVDSTAVVVRLWTEWATSQGLDPEPLLAISHGRPATETMRYFLPDLPNVQEQVAAHIRKEEQDVAGVVPIAGAREILASLPPERWAIVTSCPGNLARVRRNAAGIPEPKVIVTADDIQRGKPAPDCFLLAAEQLGFRPEECVVVEDSPAGVQAGLAAGMQVIGLLTTHKQQELPQADVFVPNLSHVRVTFGESGQLALEVA